MSRVSRQIRGLSLIFRKFLVVLFCPGALQIRDRLHQTIHLDALLSSLRQLYIPEDFDWYDGVCIPVHVINWHRNHLTMCSC